MPTTFNTLNAQVREILNNYFSAYTGAEIDAAVASINSMMPLVDSSISIPYGTLTGDYASTPIATPIRDVWLESIVLVCRRAFSSSSSGIQYSIMAGNEVLVAIPNDFMRDTESTLVYPIQRAFDAGTVFTMECTSTKAYGEVLVKLITA